MKSRQRPNADVEIGCRTVTVCHLGNIAYWLNRPIRWDPVHEVILGDEEASRWLERANANRGAAAEKKNTWSR